MHALLNGSITHHPLHEPNELEDGLQHLESGFTGASDGGVVEVDQRLGGKGRGYARTGPAQAERSAKGVVGPGRALCAGHAITQRAILSRLAVPWAVGAPDPDDSSGCSAQARTAPRTRALLFLQGAVQRVWLLAVACGGDFFGCGLALISPRRRSFLRAGSIHQRQSDDQAGRAAEATARPQ